MQVTRDVVGKMLLKEKTLSIVLIAPILLSIPI